MSDKEINIRIQSTNEEVKDSNRSLEFELDNAETQAPILETGQIGEVIIPVKVIKFSNEKTRYVKNGKARIQGDFKSLTASQMRESLDVAER
jgi:hypothetical protein